MKIQKYPVLVVLIFQIFLGVSVSQADISTSQEIFNRNWNYSSLRVLSQDTSRVHTKMFRRQIWIGKIPIHVADTNFIFLENPKKDPDPHKNELSFIAESIKKSFGKEMIISGAANHLTIIGKFEKINRHIKISLKKSLNSVYIITTFSRLGLYSKLEKEIDELHLMLSKYDGKLPLEKKTTWFQRFSFIQEAQAVETGGLNLSSLIGGSNINLSEAANQFRASTDYSELTGGVQQIGTSLDQANNTATRAVDQVETANTNWAGTNVELGKANETAGKFADEANVANKNWANTNKEMTKANITAEKFERHMNTNWAESNKILARATDPQHMAKLAFYTAAGAALGGVAVNLAIQGASEGISFLHELFTGTKKKALQWSDFEKAMNAWDTQLNDLIKMEQFVDDFLAAFKFFEEKKLNNNYEKNLMVAIRDMKFDREQFQLKSQDQQLDLECRKTYFNAADELDHKIQEYENIIQFATKNNLSIHQDSDSFFCSQLKQLQKRLIDAETQMQDLRLKILVAENQFYKKQAESLDTRDKDIKETNKKLTKTLKEKNKYDAKIVKRMKQAASKDRSSWISNCMKGKNEQGQMIKEEFSKTFFLFSYFKKKKRCGEEYGKIEEMLSKREENSEKMLSVEEDLRRSLDLKANTSVEMKQSAEQVSWMAKIHMDAYCYQFSHQKRPLPKKCSEFPEVLYSVGLARGYEKASDAYKNKCMDRYVHGLEQLAKSP